VTDDGVDDDGFDVVGEVRTQGQPRLWRAQMRQRLLSRLRLIYWWVRGTILPHFGGRAAGAASLIALGKLADAASFIVATHILTAGHSLREFSQIDIHTSLIWAAAALAFGLLLGNAASYIGTKLAVTISLAYERECLVYGAYIAHTHAKRLTPAELQSLTKQAPRLMGRALFQMINLGTSAALAVAGLVVCLFTLPFVMLLAGAVGALSSPVFIAAAVHSTNVGHSLRGKASPFSASLARMRTKWLNAPSFDFEEARRDVRSDDDYNAYLNSYGDRLLLSARSRVLSSAFFALIVGVSLFWLSGSIDAAALSVPTIVTFLVFLKIFAHGLAGVFNGVQILNASLPFFLRFLQEDARVRDVSMSQRLDGSIGTER
jgi:hypothetical protein